MVTPTRRQPCISEQTVINVAAKIAATPRQGSTLAPRKDAK